MFAKRKYGRYKIYKKKEKKWSKKKERKYKKSKITNKIEGLKEILIERKIKTKEL